MNPLLQGVPFFDLTAVQLWRVGEIEEEHMPVSTQRYR
jgi:hypothetical protein